MIPRAARMGPNMYDCVVPGRNLRFLFWVRAGTDLEIMLHSSMQDKAGVPQTVCRRLRTDASAQVAYMV